MGHRYTEFDIFPSLGIIIVGLVIVAVAMIKLDNIGYRYILAGTFGSLMATIGVGLFIFMKSQKKND